jgi:hypothetical protein
MNWFAFNYWWFIWLIFIIAILLFTFKCCKKKEDNFAQQNVVHLNSIDSLLYNCSDCGFNNSELVLDSLEDKQVNQLPCDASPKSGTDGETINKHDLGASPGTVTIAYDMDNVPDKMEVFYEKKLIASTNSIPGNENGFVGEQNVGCCNSLTFDYKPNVDKYCIVVITGGTGTVWSYHISCPE